MGGALLDPIALADLMGAIFIHEGMVAGVFDHRLVEQGLVAFELDEQVIAGGDHEFSGFFGCGVHPA